MMTLALLKIFTRTGTGILAFKNPYPISLENNQKILSVSGDVDETAHIFFQTLHQLDSLKLDRIIAERVPNVGIGITINEWLEKAPVKK